MNDAEKFYKDKNVLMEQLAANTLPNGNEIKRMSLVSRKTFIKAVGLDKIGFLKKPVASTMMNIVQINKLNKLYDKLKDKGRKRFF